MKSQSELKLYPKAGIISTLEDLHGERRTREDLLSFCSGLPKRMPIGIQHDMSRVTRGYLENFSVVPIEGSTEEWKLIGDLYLDDSDQGPEVLSGLSLSYSQVAKSNTEGHADGCIYLPFPHYRNEDLNRLLLELPLPLAVGRWHRKGAEIEPVGLIISFILFALSPIWTEIFDTKIRPFLSGVLDRLGNPEFDGVAFDYGQTITLGDDREIRVILVSDHQDWRPSLQPDRVRTGLEEAFRFLTEHPIGTVKPVDQIRLKYDQTTGTYSPLLIHYADGEHLTIG